MLEVRRIVTGYDPDGNLEVTRDALVPSLGKSPAGEAAALWTTASIPQPLDNDGQPADPTVVRWFVVKVPPDKDRGPAADDFEAGILHEGNTVDLVIVLSGEIWLELDGLPEWMHLKAGDTVVQRGTKHAWHNPTDVAAHLSCVILAGERTDGTPSRLTAEDHDFSEPHRPKD